MSAQPIPKARGELLNKTCPPYLWVDVHWGGGGGGGGGGRGLFSPLGEMLSPSPPHNAHLTVCM